MIYDSLLIGLRKSGFHHFHFHVQIFVFFFYFKSLLVVLLVLNLKKKPKKKNRQGWEIYSKEGDEKNWQEKYNEYTTRPKSKSLAI